MRCKSKDVFEISKMFHEKVINNFKSFPFENANMLIINLL